MNATEIADFANLIRVDELDSLPGWVKEHIEQHADEIVAAVRGGKEYTIQGPGNAQVTFRSETRAA